MAEAQIILDSGPLVAFLNDQDAHHNWATTQFQQLQPPFDTCEPVLTETFFLIRRQHGGIERFFTLLDRGLVRVTFSILSDRLNLKTLIQKYSSVPMSLADACLVRMAELNDDAVVFTVDSDFRVYRKHGHRTIPLIAP